MTENSTKKTQQLKIFRLMIIINLCIKQYTQMLANPSF